MNSLLFAIGIVSLDLISYFSVHSFVLSPIRTRYSHPYWFASIIRRYDNPSDDNEGVMFPEDQMSKLKERMMQQFNKTKQKEERIARNWENGNWSVRGFSLDSRDAKDTFANYDDDIEEKKPIHICTLSMGPEGEYGIAVGRTNGSVCIIQLGGEYLGKFSSVAKLTLVEQRKSSSSYAESDVTVPTAKLVSQLVRDDENGGNERFPGDKAGYNTPKEDDLITKPEPFQILLQFDAHNDEISSLLYDGMHTFVTSGGGDYTVKQWEIPRNLLKPDLKRDSLVPKLLKAHNFHTARVTKIKQIYSPQLDKELIVTFSLDGSFTLWDPASGEIISAVSVLTNDGDLDPITCADIEDADGLICVGTASGNVLVYSIRDVEEQSDGSVLKAICRFSANNEDEGLSSIHILCNNHTGSGSLSKPSSSDICTWGIVTGGEKGTLKRWQILGTKQPNGNLQKLNHWPRLSTQRLPQNAHVFKGHNDAITSIKTLHNVIISGAKDGSIRIWNPTSGEALYSMEGFTEGNVDCVVYNNALLVTSGMGKYVCLHDFDSVEDLNMDA